MENSKNVTFKDLQINLSSDQDLSSLEASTELAAKALYQFLSLNFQLESINSYSLELSIVSDTEIREINLEHRDKDKATDVLSFPMHEDIRNKKYDSHSSELFLGDILISIDTCKRQAKEHGIDFEDEYIHLLFHGVLHLLGYDHEIDSNEEKLMFDLESALILKASEIKKASK